MHGGRDADHKLHGFSEERIGKLRHAAAYDDATAAGVCNTCHGANRVVRVSASSMRSGAHA